MDNIRSVTTNPPTTLTVASTKAVKPSVVASTPPPLSLSKMAPTIVMPEIAFDPDISGV